MATDDSDETAFLQMIGAIQHDLRAYLYTLLQDPVEVDDCFQEVVLQLWRDVASFIGADEPGAWARVIARNRVVQRWRRSKRWPQQPLPADIADLLDQAEAVTPFDEATRRALRRCLADLPTERRELLQQRYDQGLDLQALADAHARSPAAMGKVLQRLRQRLADCIQRRRGDR